MKKQILITAFLILTNGMLFPDTSKKESSLDGTWKFEFYQSQVANDKNSSVKSFTVKISDLKTPSKTGPQFNFHEIKTDLPEYRENFGWVIPKNKELGFVLFWICGCDTYWSGKVNADGTINGVNEGWFPDNGNQGAKGFKLNHFKAVKVD